MHHILCTIHYALWLFDIGIPSATLVGTTADTGDPLPPEIEPRSSNSTACGDGLSLRIKLELAKIEEFGTRWFVVHHEAGQSARAFSNVRCP